MWDAITNYTAFMILTFFWGFLDFSKDNLQM